MSKGFLTPCLGPGCRGLVRGGGYCPTCAPKYKPKPGPDHRPSAAKRGYGRKWRAYCRWYLTQPGNEVCRACGRPGTAIQDLHVDHIKPVSGPDDPLFWDESNHQPLCGPCHSKKTRHDVRAGRTKNKVGTESKEENEKGFGKVLNRLLSR